MRRAKNFVRQLDVIIDFVSNIIADVKSLSEHENDEDIKNYEMDDDYWDISDVDVFFKRDKTYLKYVNPLQLVDKDGNDAPNNKIAELKKEGYIFDAMTQNVIFKGF